MLANRREQENLTHEHQTTAAAKSLNQNVRGLAPKTPGNNGNKTKAPLRSAARDDENTVILGKSNKNAFVTPTAPRERAPLGAKPTNAKSHAFQTPAPQTRALGLQQTQRKSASARKPKLKIHQPEAVDAEPITHDDQEDADFPEVEYCPPKITELPDIPDYVDGFEPDKKFPQFEGGNMIRGAYSLYCNPVGEDGLTKAERESEESMKRLDALAEQEFQRSMEEFDAYFELPGLDKKLNAASTSNSQTFKPSYAARPAPSKAKSKSAAVALSNGQVPSFAASTASARAKASAALPSRSTIGYSKGRKVSSNLREQKGTSVEKPKADTFWENFEQILREQEELHKSRVESSLEADECDEIIVPWNRDLQDLLQDDISDFQFPGH